MKTTEELQKILDQLDEHCRKAYGEKVALWRARDYVAEKLYREQSDLIANRLSHLRGKDLQSMIALIDSRIVRVLPTAVYSDALSSAMGVPVTMTGFTSANPTDEAREAESPDTGGTEREVKGSISLYVSETEGQDADHSADKADDSDVSQASNGVTGEPRRRRGRPPGSKNRVASGRGPDFTQ